MISIILPPMHQPNLPSSLPSCPREQEPHDRGQPPQSAAAAPAMSRAIRSRPSWSLVFNQAGKQASKQTNNRETGRSQLTQGDREEKVVSSNPAPTRSGEGGKLKAHGRGAVDSLLESFRQCAISNMQGGNLKLVLAARLIGRLHGAAVRATHQRNWQFGPVTRCAQPGPSFGYHVTGDRG
jgi:hypothetical protein